MNGLNLKDKTMAIRGACIVYGVWDVRGLYLISFLGIKLLIFSCKTFCMDLLLFR